MTPMWIGGPVSPTGPMSRGQAALAAAPLALVPTATPLAAEEGTWSKDAVIYEALGRSVFDSDGDAHGDCNRLTLAR